MRKKLITVLSCILFWGATTQTMALNKSISRTEDPIVVLGKDLKSLRNTKPETLSLMAYNDGKFIPIPFQIDERHKDGKFAYKSGKKASKDADPNFDDNDDLVFMIEDAGDRAPSRALPKSAEHGAELEIRDPLDNGKCWVYLFKFCKNAPRSSFDYIRMVLDTEKGTKRVYGKDKSGKGIIVGSPLDTILPNEMRVMKSNGTEGPDVLDRIKIRGKLDPKFFFTIDFKLDKILREKLAAWTDGPVRIIYLGEGYFKIGFIKVPGLFISMGKYYHNCCNANLDVSFPGTAKARTFLNEFPLQGMVDMNENAYGTKVFSEFNPPCDDVILDGKVSQAEKKLDTKTHSNWIVGYGPHGSIVHRTFLPESWEPVNQTFFITEQPDTLSPPEDHKGQLSIGFSFNGIEKVEVNNVFYDIYFYLVNDFKLGDEKGILNIIDHPVEVICRIL